MSSNSPPPPPHPLQPQSSLTRRASLMKRRLSRKTPARTTESAIAASEISTPTVSTVTTNEMKIFSISNGVIFNNSKTQNTTYQILIKNQTTRTSQVGDERRTSDFRVADVVSVVTEEVPAQVTHTIYKSHIISYLYIS